MIGLSNAVWVPLANVYGRRPVLLVSALCLFVASICGISPGSFASFVGIRMFQGVGSSATEAVTIAAVGDMYFISMRSRRMVCQISCATRDVGCLTWSPTGLLRSRYGHRRYCRQPLRRIHWLSSRMARSVRDQRCAFGSRASVPHILRSRDHLRPRPALSPGPAKPTPSIPLLPADTGAAPNPRHAPFHEDDPPPPLPRLRQD
jgi:hypothetical protein